ncbi:MAG: tRNA (guanine-N7-)-methyltransferase [Flavobacteriaceae bacterium]|jgi:tRNA (guanine-N7-)-methyltransferase
MGKDKIRRFAAVKEFQNFFEPVIREPSDLGGNWGKGYFKNDNPIILELGCGKGEYSVGLAKHFPDKNFIACDIKGARMFIGAEEALEEKLTNVAFLRAKIDFISDYFIAGEIDEIWLTFSDPQPKKPNKRLSSKVFMDRYRKILKPNGIIHMKTDSDLLFEFTEEEIKLHGYDLLELTWDLYGDLPENIDPVTREIFHIKTHYEKLFTAKGSVIKYCKFRIG